MCFLLQLWCHFCLCCPGWQEEQQPGTPGGHGDGPKGVRHQLTVLSSCGGERRLKCTLAFGWEGEASEARELAQGTWRGLKPQLETSGLCQEVLHSQEVNHSFGQQLLGRHLLCAGDEYTDKSDRANGGQNLVQTGTGEGGPRTASWER